MKKNVRQEGLYRTIAVGLMVMYGLLFVYSPSVVAFENFDKKQEKENSIRKKDEAWHEPAAVVPDRHVLNRQDYMNDPENHISVPQSVRVSEKDLVTPVVEHQETIIERLDRKIRTTLKYDPTAKKISESKMPEDVLKTGRGNCFEIAGLAMMVLSTNGYKAHIINIKIANHQDWHSICIFKEPDGRWSYFQASDKFMGYFPVGAIDVQDLVLTNFNNVVDVKFIM